MNGDFVSFIKVRIGTVVTVPTTPKKMSSGLRPMRSDKRAIKRLDPCGEQQREEDDECRRIRRQTDREPHISLHVGGEGVEGRGAARGQPDDEKQFAWIGHQGSQQARSP